MESFSNFSSQLQIIVRISKYLFQPFFPGRTKYFFEFVGYELSSIVLIANSYFTTTFTNRCGTTTTFTI